MSIQSVWIAEGRPRQGFTCCERLRVRAAYKHAIREAKKAPKQAAWDRLHTAMECQDTNSFWKWWRSLYGSSSSKCASVIEGQSSKEGIANVFKDTFKKNSQPNNQSKVDER